MNFGFHFPFQKIWQKQRIKSISLVILLTACTNEPETNLSIGSNTWLGYEPFYVARELGYYDNNIKLVHMTSATAVSHALRNGAIDGAMLTLDEALTIISDGHNLKLILVIDYSNGADSLLTKPDINSLQELRGKRIAAEYTAVGALMLNSVLEFAQIDLSEITLVACELDAHIDCYSESDAIITLEPVKTALLNQGAKALFDSSQVPGLIFDVLVVNELSVKSHTESLKKLVAGYFKAKDFMSLNKQISSKMIGKRLQLTAEEVIHAYKGVKLIDLKNNHRYLNSADSPLKSPADKLFEIMIEKKLLSNKFNLQDHIDGSFLPVGKK